MTSTRTVVTSRRTKVLGSLGVLATAAAVAGLGTFGTFTDSTTPVSTDVTSGTVSIDLSLPGTAIPVQTTGFLPGDSVSRPVDLHNDGTSPLSTVRLATTAPGSSVLTTDTTDGLQLSVRSCATAWTQGGTTAAPTFTCAAGASSLYAGPAVTDTPMLGLASLEPGAVDHLVVTLALPETAGDEFQDARATLSLAFTGVQRAGAAR